MDKTPLIYLLKIPLFRVLKYTIITVFKALIIGGKQVEKINLEYPENALTLYFKVLLNNTIYHATRRY